VASARTDNRNLTSDFFDLPFVLTSPMGIGTANTAVPANISPHLANAGFANALPTGSISLNWQAAAATATKDDQISSV
jgi:hypothetical protein